MTVTQEYVGTLIVIDCGECGVTFGLDDSFVRERRRDHRTWYCPNGHARHYPAKSDIEKAREEAEQARRALAAARSHNTHLADQLGAERRSKAAVKGHLTRIKKRIANGVCPCCQRSFANVTRHMSSQHPEFVEDLRAKEAEVADG